MPIKVSVIIPVYNAAKYLDRCVESLMNQTLQNCEFIFVNDGSTDNSEELIAQYQHRDRRIKLVNQNNGGVSSARNFGLQHATGVYIGFVDADDFITTNMYQTMYVSAVQDHCDIVFTDLLYEQEGKNHILGFPFPTQDVMSEDDVKSYILPFFLKSDEMNSVCNKLYRRTLLQEHAITFPEGVALGEDGLFNMNAFSVAKAVLYLDRPVYHYCDVSGSATRNLNEVDYFRRVLQVYHSELPTMYRQMIDPATITRLKSIKFISSLLANIHVYYASSELTFREKFIYVNRMIRYPEVSAAIPYYLEERGSDIGRYQKVMLQLITLKSTLGIYALTGYSRYRNRTNRRESA